MKVKKNNDNTIKDVERSKDQLEFATNWRRVFMEIY